MEVLLLTRPKTAPRATRPARHLLPGDAESLYQGWKAQGDDPEHEYIRQALTLDPDHGPAHVSRGDAYFRKGRYKEAAEEFRQAIRIDPGDAAAQHQLGLALFRLGEYGAAIPPYLKALRLQPDDPAIHLHLGEVLILFIALLHNNLPANFRVMIHYGKAIIPVYFA